jgi:hypothetical protein
MEDLALALKSVLPIDDLAIVCQLTSNGHWTSTEGERS